MRRRGSVLAVAVGAVMMLTALATAGEKVVVLDDCDPNDPGWAPTGGCARAAGDVTVAEFLSPSVLPEGHPAWRNKPSYLKITLDERVKVINKGGRRHTFTEVAEFGGGFVPSLNNPPFSAPVPECAGDLSNPAVASSDLPPGARLALSGLGGGTHLFQCCIHPWMRAAIKVIEEEDEEEAEE
jgi:hypothetical protein